MKTAQYDLIAGLTAFGVYGVLLIANKEIFSPDSFEREVLEETVKEKEAPAPRKTPLVNFIVYSLILLGVTIMGATIIGIVFNSELIQSHPSYEVLLFGFTAMPALALALIEPHSKFALYMFYHLLYVYSDKKVIIIFAGVFEVIEALIFVFGVYGLLHLELGCILLLLILPFIGYFMKTKKWKARIQSKNLKAGR